MLPTTKRMRNAMISPIVAFISTVKVSVDTYCLHLQKGAAHRSVRMRVKSFMITMVHPSQIYVFPEDIRANFPSGSRDPLEWPIGLSFCVGQNGRLWPFPSIVRWCGLLIQGQFDKVRADSAAMLKALSASYIQIEILGIRFPQTTAHKKGTWDLLLECFASTHLFRSRLSYFCIFKRGVLGADDFCYVPCYGERDQTYRCQN